MHAIWTINVGRGLFSAFVIVASADLIANFFNEPKATLTIQLVGVISFIRATRSMGVVYNVRNTKFAEQAVQDFFQLITDAVAAIVIALILRDARALAYGALAGEIVATVVSYLRHPYRPKFIIVKSELKNLVSFSRWIYVSQILIFLNVGLPGLVIGRVLGVSSLGLFQIATRVAAITTHEIGKVISSAAFPVYSRLKDHDGDLKGSYRELLKNTLAISLPLAALPIFHADFIIQTILGVKWSAAAEPMKILSFAGLFSAIAAVGTPMFRAIGRPELETQAQVVRTVLLCFLIGPGIILFGLNGVSGAIAFAACGWMTFVLWRIGRIFELSAANLAGACMEPIGLFALAVLASGSMTQIPLTEALSLPLQITVFLIVYLLLTLFARRHLGRSESKRSR